MDLPPALEGTGYPGQVLYNLGIPAHPAISYFVCIDHYDEYPECAKYDADPMETEKDQVLSSFKLTRPDVVTIHDTHFVQKSDDIFKLPRLYDKALAFNAMAMDAMANGAQTIFYLTQSMKSESNDNLSRYNDEVTYFMQVVDALGCHEGDENSIRVSVINWAELTCPEIVEGSKTCAKEQHGFDDILPDDSHPFGDSGLWLTRESLAMVLEQVTQNFLPEEFHTQTPFENPASAALLDLAPPDDAPPLEELMFNYYFCTTTDYAALKEKSDAINPTLEPGGGEVRTSYADSEFLILGDKHPRHDPNYESGHSGSGNNHSGSGSDHNGNGHAGDGHNGNGHAGDGHNGNGHAGDGHNGNGHNGNGHAGDGHNGNGHNGNGHSGHR